MKTIVLVAVVAIACKKSNPQGLPPAADWGSGSGSAASAQATPPPDQQLPPNHPPTADQLPPNHPPTTPPGHPPTTPPGHSPTTPPTAKTGPAKSLAKLPGGKLALGPYAIATPAGWTEVPTTSDMRAAQFKIGSDAELVVYYFGDQGAGDTQANLDRWASQFTKPDGKPKIEKLKVAGQEATLMSVSGHYTAMAMGAGESVDKDNQMMLAAITASPSGPYYWKLVGGRATVTANAAKFRSLLTSIAIKK